MTGSLKISFWAVVFISCYHSILINNEIDIQADQLVGQIGIVILFTSLNKRFFLLSSHSFELVQCLEIAISVFSSICTLPHYVRERERERLSIIAF